MEQLKRYRTARPSRPATWAAAAIVALFLAAVANAQVAVPVTALPSTGTSPRTPPPVPMWEDVSPKPITPAEYVRAMRARQRTPSSIPPERSRAALKFNLIAPKPARGRN